MAYFHPVSPCISSLPLSILLLKIKQRCPPPFPNSHLSPCLELPRSYYPHLKDPCVWIFVIVASSVSSVWNWLLHSFWLHSHTHAHPARAPVPVVHRELSVTKLSGDIPWEETLHCTWVLQWCMGIPCLIQLHRTPLTNPSFDNNNCFNCGDSVSEHSSSGRPPPSSPQHPSNDSCVWS